jgi:hypothetical protein
MALSSEKSQLDSNSHREQNWGTLAQSAYFSHYKKVQKKIYKKPYGFNDKVATKKSNAKKYINEML